jgi:hypothetical protein
MSLSLSFCAPWPWRLGMVEQASRPQRLWHGLVLLLLPAALVGGLSTSAEAQSCVSGISSSTPGATVTNNGCITTTTVTFNGISSGGANSTITNSGTITTSGASAYGISSSGANATITNDTSGTITTSGTSAYGINSSGASATITNDTSGTITTSSSGAIGIRSSGGNAAITNSGTITTSRSAASGIRSSGTNATITNSGTITATSFHGIQVGGSGATISNRGVITAGVGSFGIQLFNSGSVVTLVNAQGGATPLTYTGALPGTYNVVVQSPSSFGRLAVTTPSGTMTFGVDATSNLAVNRYTNVLTGVSASDITNEETQFTLGLFAWMLTAGSTANSWDLLASLTGPDAAATQLGLQSNSGAVRSVLSQRAAVTTYALDYDCPLFDKHGFCVSVGARNTQIGSNYGDGGGETSGQLTAAYRVTPQFRIGAFIDHRVTQSKPAGINYSDDTPSVGTFVAYDDRGNGTGMQGKLTAVYNTGKVGVTRSASSANTEAGSGRSSLTSYAIGAELGWGFKVNEGWVANPYAGLKHTSSKLGAYAEQLTDSVEFPISYAAYGQRLTAATAGIRIGGRLTDRVSLALAAGIEHDLRSTVDAYAGASDIPGLASFSFSTHANSNRTRRVGSATLGYQIDSNQRVSAGAYVRENAYAAQATKSLLMQYEMAF